MLLYQLQGGTLLLLTGLACLTHELGHYLVLRLAGGRVASLRLSVTGAEMRLDASRPLGYEGELLALLAGPTANLLLASLCMRWGNGLFGGMNLALACFNLLPIYPLDGGRLLSLILIGLLPVHWVDGVVQGISLGLAVLLWGLGLWLLWVGGQNPSLLIVGTWLVLSTIHTKNDKNLLHFP